MRKVIILVLCAVVLCLVAIYFHNNSIDKVMFQEVDPLSIRDKSLSETLNSNLKDGVYTLSNEKKSYVIFNGIDNTYKSISCKTSGKTFEILFSKEQHPGNEQIVYEYALPENIDTIDLLQDGKSIGFLSSISSSTGTMLYEFSLN